MYNTLLKLWKKKNSPLTEESLDKAVSLGWITETEAKKIAEQPHG